jgi:hypothetical protein
MAKKSNNRRNVLDKNEYSDLLKGMSARLSAFRMKAEEEMIHCNRNPAELTLIGVSKFFPVEYARAAAELGLKDLGENRISELVEKKEALSAQGMEPNWHLIGTLQTNKVKFAIGQTALIHSVDSSRLLEEISSRSVNMNLRTSILLQLNISGEDTKHGFSKDGIEETVHFASGLPGISLCGMMTMAPIVPCEYTPRKVFEELREVFEKTARFSGQPEKWKVLSMGMSNDYVDAIQCGATHIRIGTLIFGPRMP